MSKAKTTFESAIKDAETLLDHFNAINQQPPPESAEVLKRAGLVMALTAWETYVEDRVTEQVQASLKFVDGSHVGKFVLSRLEEELRRFHTPNAEKTRRLFQDYLGVDVTSSWTFQHYDPPKAKKYLDELIAKRGDVVHRSRANNTKGPSQPHLVKKDELEKAIRFFRGLVDATDKALEGD
jgi:hypothetical protein